MPPMIDQIGGETTVRQIVERFYDLIETLPQGRAIMEMHQKGHGLAHVRPAQFEFLCGFFGGRRYFEERNGHMNLREIHAHVEITRQDADDWLAVMDRALADTGVAAQPRYRIMAVFRNAAASLVNR